MRWFPTGGSQLVVDRLVTELFGLQKLLSQRYYKNDHAIKYSHDIGLRIENLWAEYQEEANRLDKPIKLASSGGHQYRDAFTAMTVAYFSAARILLSTVSSPQIAQYSASSEAMDGNSQLILNCSSFLMRKDTGCAYLRTFLPLTLVARYSASSEQRTLARTLWSAGSMARRFVGLAQSLSSKSSQPRLRILRHRKRHVKGVRRPKLGKDASSIQHERFPSCPIFEEKNIHRVLNISQVTIPEPKPTEKLGPETSAGRLC